jgi:hypothetical protein
MRGWKVVEEKDFVKVGSKSQGRITLPIAFWPANSKEQMEKVLEQMKEEKPDLTFTLEEVE